MAVPLVVILGVLIWMFTAIVKWHIAKNYKYQNPIDEETLRKLQRGSMTDEQCQEALDNFRRKKAAEEQSRANKSRGKTLFDEMDDRIRDGKKGRQAQDSRPKYTPDMFHDTVSRMHEELMKKRQSNEESREHIKKLQ